MNSTIILKGNILYTPNPSALVSIQQGYVIAVDGVVVHSYRQRKRLRCCCRLRNSFPNVLF